MTMQATEHSPAAQRRIIREYLSFTCNHLPAGKCFKCHVRNVWNIARCGYASFNSFYNTVRPLFNSNRLKFSDTPPEFEYEILRDTAALICRHNPNARLKPTALDLCKMCGYDGTQANQFYQKVKKHFQRHPYSSPTNR